MSDREFKGFLLRVEIAYVMGYKEYADMIDFASIILNDNQWQKLSNHLENKHKEIMDSLERSLPYALRRYNN